MNFKHYKGYTIKVESTPDSAIMFFSDFEFASRIICFHHKYSLGETHSEFNSLVELKEYLDNGENYFLPIYLYDHSGQTIKTTPFNDAFDSGLLGFVFISKEEIANSSLVGEMDPKEYAEKIMNEEISLYDAYIRGEEYNIDIFEGELSKEELEEADETKDGCFGFIGDIEKCFIEGQSMVDNRIKVKEDSNA